MGMLCAVTFTSNGQLHYADPGELRPEVGDMVLLPTEQGSVAARVVWAAEYSPEETEGFPVLIGMADEADLAATEQMRKTKARTMVASRRLIREHGLPMKVLAVDPQPGSGKTVIYYSSPETVDFRSLLRDLSATLGSRIELRQPVHKLVVDVLPTVEANAGDRAEVEIGAALAALDHVDIEPGGPGEEVESGDTAASECRGNERVIVGPLIIGYDSDAAPNCDRVAKVIGIRKRAVSRLSQRRR